MHRFSCFPFRALLRNDLLTPVSSLCPWAFRAQIIEILLIQTKANPIRAAVKPKNIDSIIVVLWPVRNLGRILAMLFEEVFYDINQFQMFPSDEKQLTFVARIQQLAFQSFDIVEPEVAINRHPEPYRRGLDRCQWSDVIEPARLTIDFSGRVRCV